MVAINSELLAAVKQTKKEAHAQLSHKRQLGRIRSRGYQQAKVAETKSRARQAEIGSRQAGTLKLIEERERGRASRKPIAPYRASAREQIRSQAQTRAINTGFEAIGTAASIATPSSDSNLFMTTVFVIVGLALFYQLVTKSGQFSGLVSRTGDFLHTLSSTTPLFTTTK